jgi:single-strand DNA-binding protein
MNEPFVTFQGWVGTEVVHRVTKQGSVANFRVGCTPRFKRAAADEWEDGPTSWFSVSCWRALADNVRDSVRKGDPVVVHGRLNTDVWKREDGQTSTTYVVVAQHVGHDLSRGTSQFSRSSRGERAGGFDEADPTVKAILHGEPGDLPQLDSLGNVRPVPDDAVEQGSDQSPAA